MVQFNEDVLFLIFEEIKNDKLSLYSCLLVNRTWCVTAVPILWRNPGQYFMINISRNKLFNMIILHLSEESRVILKNQGMKNLITKKYQRPLFNYISFWKHLDLFLIEDLISQRNIGKSNKSIIRNEILKLFINKITKFIQLSIPHNFNYQLHIIPGAEYCLSELESFQCDVDIAQNILKGLARICKSIKNITIYVGSNICIYENYELIKFIEMQKNLNDFRLFNISYSSNECFYKTVEESLIKHADTVQYLRIGWSPITRFLSYFLNLLSLEIDMMPIFTKSENPNLNNPNYLKNLSLPILKILNAYFVPLNILVNLIENTTENLSEISIHCVNVMHYDGCKMLIQAIYQNCPNIKYLKLSLNRYLLISEFENLLINCQYLNGLIINVCDDDKFWWGKLFKVLTESSPSNLFKFKFYSKAFKLKDIKSFFDNWKSRRSLLLEIMDSNTKADQQLVNLIEQYKAKGIIERYCISMSYAIHEDFVWK
jgi:hypothetical protein